MSSMRVGERSSPVSPQRSAETQQNPVRAEPPPPQPAPQGPRSRQAPQARDAFVGAQATATAQPARRRTPEEELRADPKFNRLNEATRNAALARARALGDNPIAQQNLRGLVTSDGFAQLNPTHQRAMLSVQARAPADRQLTQDLTALAGNPAFRNLGDPVKSTLLTQLGRHPTDAAARQTLTQLATSPGFARLSNAEKNRFLNYVGGTNANLSTPARQALGTLLGSDGFRRATPQQQQTQLRDFLTRQSTAPNVVAAINGPGTLARAPYTVHGPTEVKNHAFRSGAADANRYEVEIGGRRIPVFVPSRPNAANGSFHSIDQVARGLAALPAASRAVVNQVSVDPAQNPDDAYWARQYGDPNFRSYMTAGADGNVTIYPTLGGSPSQDGLDGSLIHETGHTLSMRAWGGESDKRWDAWRTASQNDGIRPSSYAASSPGEDFSETLVLYNRVRGTPQEAEFRAMMPERFRILDRMVGGTR
jgi:hypothetical protein